MWRWREDRRKEELGSLAGCCHGSLHPLGSKHGWDLMQLQILPLLSNFEQHLDLNSGNLTEKAFKHFAIRQPIWLLRWGGTTACRTRSTFGAWWHLYLSWHSTANAYCDGPRPGSSYSSNNITGKHADEHICSTITGGTNSSWDINNQCAHRQPYKHYHAGSAVSPMLWKHSENTCTTTFQNTDIQADWWLEQGSSYLTIMNHNRPYNRGCGPVMTGCSLISLDVLNLVSCALLGQLQCPRCLNNTLLIWWLSSRCIFILGGVNTLPWVSFWIAIRNMSTQEGLIQRIFLHGISLSSCWCWLWWSSFFHGRCVAIANHQKYRLMCPTLVGPCRDVQHLPVFDVCVCWGLLE